MLDRKFSLLQAVSSLPVLFLALSVWVTGCGTGNPLNAAPSVASTAVGGSGGTSGGSGTNGSGASSSSGSGSGSGSSSGGSGSSGTGSAGSGSSSSSDSSSTGTVIANVQTSSGNWQSWGQPPPYTADCTAPCAGVTWGMQYGVSSPSLSGSATQFSLGGTTPYADALFSAQLMGQNSPQIPDDDHSLLPTLHNFVYETDFYVANAAVTQVLEFDISMYMNGVGMIWGQQCDYLGDGDWDIWDNARAKWVSAGVPCQFVNGWNHLKIEMQREADNSLLYKTITLNGTTYTLNRTYPPGTAPTNWWGVTANFQLDGDARQAAYKAYLDNFNVTYW